MKFDLIIKNANIVTSEDVFFGDLAVLDGKIVRIDSKIEAPAEKIIEASGKYLLPGVIDVHVHLREPGNEEKEDIFSGTRAALSGGVTTVFDMPNTNPAVTSQAVLDQKIKIAKEKANCHLGFYLGVDASNLDQIDKISGYVAVKVYMAGSTGSLILDQYANLEKLFQLKTDKLLCFHAEDEDLIREAKAFYQEENDPEIHSCIRHRGAATQAVSNLIELAKKYDQRIHICHISTKEELDLIRTAKKEGVRITCEVAPHHLFMHDGYYTSMKNFVKTNPPMRSESDNESLFAGLLDGSIDFIATDHAPHLKEEKEKEYHLSPSGVPGLETALALMLNEVNEGKIIINQVAEVMSKNPAMIFGIQNKGEIKTGFDADLVLVDPEKFKTVKWGELVTKCNWSPFQNWELQGWPVMTFLKGELVFDAGTFLKPKKVDIIGK